MFDVESLLCCIHSFPLYVRFFIFLIFLKCPDEPSFETIALSFEKLTAPLKHRHQPTQIVEKKIPPVDAAQSLSHEGGIQFGGNLQ